MKKILYILPAVLLTFASCSQDDMVPTPGTKTGEKDFSFTVNIPDAKALTKAWVAGSEYGSDSEGDYKVTLITNMHVMLFDENGFISLHKAESTGQVGDFKVKLPLSEKKRVLHFVCNYDFTNFSEDDAYLKSEASLMTTLNVDYPTIAYWRRMEYSNLTESTALNDPSDSSGPIRLIRNVAKISVLDNSKAAAAATQRDEEPLTNIYTYLTNIKYALGNYYDKGTVTNFNPITNLIDGTGVLEAESAGIKEMDESSDFVSAYLANFDNLAGKSLYSYERNQANPDKQANRMYIIIKGDYYTGYTVDGETEGTTDGEPRYYKIDIVHDEGESLLDVLRNEHYILNVGLVMNEGYKTLKEAVASLPQNNIATSVMQNYNSISDGKALLNIEYVNRTFVRGDPFSIRYSYITDASTGTTDNRDVKGVLVHNSAERAINADPGKIPVAALGQIYMPNQKYPGGPALGDSYLDHITGTMMGTPPASGVAQSQITVSKNNLTRTILLNLRQPFKFKNLALNPSRLPADVGAEVALSFELDPELQSLLPLTIYIYAPMLQPDATKEGNYIYHDENDPNVLFRYRYTVNSTEKQTLYFKTGSTVGEGLIRLTNDLFDDGALSVFRDSYPVVTINSITPNGDDLIPEINVPVTLNLTTDARFTATQTIRIHTQTLDFDTQGTLTPAATMTGPVVAGNDRYYEYTPGQSGSFAISIPFRTNSKTTNEQLMVDGGSLRASYVTRSNRYYDFNTVLSPATVNDYTDNLTVNFNLYNGSRLDDQEIAITVGMASLVPDGAVGENADLIFAQTENGIDYYTYTTTLSSTELDVSRTLNLKYKDGLTPRADTILLMSEQYATSANPFNFTFTGTSLDPRPNGTGDNSVARPLKFTVPERAIPEGGTLTISLTYSGNGNSCFSTAYGNGATETGVVSWTNQQIVVNQPGDYTFNYQRSGTSGNRGNMVTLNAPGFNPSDPL